MKIKITDEMKRKALDVLAGKVGGCPGLGLSDFCDDTKCECRDEISAALEAIAPLIADMALEQAAKIIEPEPVAYDYHHFKRGVCHGKKEAAATIRALKEPTP